MIEQCFNVKGEKLGGEFSTVTYCLNKTVPSFQLNFLVPNNWSDLPDTHGPTYVNRGRVELILIDYFVALLKGDSDHATLHSLRKSLIELKTMVKQAMGRHGFGCIQER